MFLFPYQWVPFFISASISRSRICLSLHWTYRNKIGKHCIVVYKVCTIVTEGSLQAYTLNEIHQFLVAPCPLAIQKSLFCFCSCCQLNQSSWGPFMNSTNIYWLILDQFIRMINSILVLIFRKTQKETRAVANAAGRICNSKGREKHEGPHEKL